MKIAIITDQHFGARKSSKFLHDHFKRFYDDIFFPYLEKHNITTVVDMGDTFDNRRSIDLWAIDWAKETYYNRLRDMGVTVHTIVGNHTAYYKNTNEVNSVDLLLKEYENVKVYSECTEVMLDRLQVLFIPWINAENTEKSILSIKGSTSDCAMGHLELNGFRAHRGHIMEDGMEGELFEKFKRVFSGHYHTRSDDGRIFYLGNPYEMFWNDVNDPRGFTIFDTDTLEHSHVDNPYSIFYNIYYEDTNYKLFDATKYKAKIVKVSSRKRRNLKTLRNFLTNSTASEFKNSRLLTTLRFRRMKSLRQTIRKTQSRF